MGIYEFKTNIKKAKIFLQNAICKAIIGIDRDKLNTVIHSSELYKKFNVSILQHLQAAEKKSAEIDEHYDCTKKTLSDMVDEAQRTTWRNERLAAEHKIFIKVITDNLAPDQAVNVFNAFMDELKNIDSYIVKEGEE